MLSDCPAEQHRQKQRGHLVIDRPFYSNTLNTLGQERGRGRTETQGRVISKQMLRLLGNSAVHDGVFINSEALVSDGPA